MSIRPRIKKNRQKLPALTPALYRFTPVVTSTTGKHSAQGNSAGIIFPNGVTLLQNPNLPRLPGQVGLRGDRPVNPDDFERAVDNSQITLPPMPEGGIIDTPELPSPSKHRNKRVKQWERWTYDILPLITPTYLDLQRRTRSMREEASLDVNTHSCGCCQSPRKLTIWLVWFSSMSCSTFFLPTLTSDNPEIERIELWTSDCSKAAVQLLRSGFFPCSPVYPTLAVDVRVLDFVRRLFLRIAPNYTAWCSAALDFLAAQGYHLPGEDPLRRRFANALQWFISLHDKVNTQIDTVLQQTRQELIPESSSTPSHLSPRAHCDNTPEELGNDADTGPATSAEEIVEDNGSRKRQRQDSDECDPFQSNDVESNFHSPLSRPTEYLRARCAACFGGDCQDVVVNVDACYTQKHSSKGGRDPPRMHPTSFFIPEADQTRPPKKQPRMDTDTQEQDHIEDGLRVPKSVLDRCLASFTAADEAHIKGSTRFFDVTANMTLLCRHDRPLFSTNIDTAGEGHVFALLSKLFEHLPPHVGVRFLYDIGCQFHRSCEKWGFLKPYSTRLTFAVSIFHAFGHQWPCQLIYHPRKCIGFGLSDGEGAERLWHSLSHLIAYGRVAGYYVRMYNLDSQFHFSSDEALYKIGLWLRRKVLACDEKLKEADAVLQRCGVDEDVLRREWRAQIKAQTKPLPRQHRNLS
ncbi:hypothetical protein C8R42DRAFT_726479 [Lentinula raphanica]|nr:hypothetical protein C8R42DRAFT_726479 [Lentinula raphanica]